MCQLLALLAGLTLVFNPNPLAAELDGTPCLNEAEIFCAEFDAHQSTLGSESDGHDEDGQCLHHVYPMIWSFIDRGLADLLVSPIVPYASSLTPRDPSLDPPPPRLS